MDLTIPLRRGQGTLSDPCAMLTMLRSERVVPMATVIVPVACDDHAVFSLWEDDVWYGLYCENCDAIYPPEAE
jgi:hypothetical protein